MRILVIGASGLIGSAVAARLHADGHHVVAAGRGSGATLRRLPVDGHVRIDVRDALRPEDWLPHLRGMDAVINCAGVLQDNERDSTARVHSEAPIALWTACEQAGLRKAIHFSALGVDRGGITPFSSTKMEGDSALERSSLDWVILRPSVVVGAPAYGGSALFRGLAALPVFPVPPDAGPADIVQLDDVAETVARFLAPGAPSRIAIELAGPDRLPFAGIVAAYRSWLGWKPARLVPVPAWLMALVWRAGDLIALLGWRPPVRSTPGREIKRGAIGDGAAWTRLTGIRPKRLAEALAARPASVQERWFARLYLLKPLAVGAFAFFWLATGIVSLTAGRGDALAYMERAGGGALSGPSVIAGSLADIAIGLGILWRPTAKRALVAALLVSLFYLAAGTLFLPELWSDPLGPMLKIVPILAFNLLCLAILDER